MSLIQTLVLPKISDGLIDVLTISGAVLSIFVITVLYKFYTDAMAAGPSSNALTDQIDRDHPSDPSDYLAAPVLSQEEQDDHDNMAVGDSDWNYDNMRDFTTPDDSDEDPLADIEAADQIANGFDYSDTDSLGTIEAADELLDLDSIEAADQMFEKEDEKIAEMELMEEAH